MDIGSFHFDQPVFLAPMAGVTDTAYRIIAHDMGCPLCYAEMVSSQGIHFRNEKTLSMLASEPEERPLAMQIFAATPEMAAEAAAFVEARGTSDILDFNMGCPAPKITKNGEGSALMKNPKLAGEILSAVKKSVKLPCSVKIRLGYDEENLNAVEIAKIAESCGIDFIAVHGRTRQQFYSGAANWEEIAKVKAAVKIPVIANGDVRDFESFDKILQVTKADGVMIGRACQGNAWLIGDLIKYFKTGEKKSPPTLTERIKIMRRHFEKLLAFKGENIAVREMRKHAAWYTKGLKGGAEFRNKFNRTETAEDFLKVLSEFGK